MKIELAAQLVTLSISTRNPDFWSQIQYACKNSSLISGSYNPLYSEVYNLIKETYVKVGCPFINTNEQRAEALHLIRERIKEVQNA